MKKFLSVAIGFVLCMLLLSGCNTSSGGNGDSGAEIGEETEIAKEAYVVVEIQINPLFSMTMDENNSILYVAGLNQDAKQLLAEVDVINMDYAEGVSVILNKAYEMEFIDEETVEINIEIMFRNEVDDAKATEMTETLKQPVIRFQEEKELGVEVVVDEPLAGVIVMNIEYENGDKGKAYYRQDSSEARILFREILEIPEGTGYKEFYYDYYDENRVIIQWNTLDYETGRYEEKWYWPRESEEEEMIKKKVIAYEPEGCVVNSIYDEEGNEVSRVMDYAKGSDLYEDGAHIEYTFYENGNLKTSIENYPDGSREEKTYFENENGKTKTWIADEADGARHEYQYDENGNIISGFSEFADGSWSENYEDGSFKYGYPDGRWVLSDADGNVIDESN